MVLDYVAGSCVVGCAYIVGDRRVYLLYTNQAISDKILHLLHLLSSVFVGSVI